MSDTIEIPADTGRNDPCPCGSGKKYKKCHMRLAQAQREAQKQTRGVEQLIGDQSVPYAVYDALAQATANNLGALIWEMSHDQGPFRQAYPAQADYLIAINEGRANLPAAPDFDFMRLRIDEPNAYLLLARGVDDPRLTRVTYEIITLLRNEVLGDLSPREVPHRGWRVWEMKSVTREKRELEDADLSLGDLGIGWHKRGLRDLPTHVRPPQEPEASAGAQEEE